ncbi:hypothetical protein CH373_15490 [Leptospira perolatii]|uniref:Beta-ketoacyl synthase n=1 Tax=Leptospira perolatii TaxID=2023191 RepID=A0A2M9ZJF8_9LEPT|nr:type I polyketide synthase [Leptospira perolatii]PJZ68820.1 hypothetical protein CH360_13950 [Leptospira perolatii]PJZ72151.1 hypothetical protein CH373_15490 [Leptospira perolatii]
MNHLVELLELRNNKSPDKLAYCFLEDGESKESLLSYSDLFKSIEKIAGNIQSITKLGDRVLLLYPPGLEYIISFLGCITAGVIPVPAYPPRNNHHVDRIKTIIKDADATAALTVDSAREKISQILTSESTLRNVGLYTYSDLCQASGNLKRHLLQSESVAFLQYTSGSTSAPKGVVVSHGNLLDNLKSQYQFSGIKEDSKSLFWLPPYHDMGLIGGILGPLYCQIPGYLMSPFHFIQRPMRWLEAITKYQITISGGPNFGYDYCVQSSTLEKLKKLNLESWKIAYNGAEFIRHSTLKSFSETFGVCGFLPSTFRAAYGLAESTLAAACSIPVFGKFHSSDLEQTDTKPAKVNEDAASQNEDLSILIGIDSYSEGQRLAIVDPITNVRCEEGKVGEIWLHGPSVALGYWNNPTQTESTFHARIQNEEPANYLRTGDLGFISSGVLYVTGRMKELLILRGVNYYPHDFENVAASSHEALHPDSIIAFSVTVKEREELVILAEIPRQWTNSIEEILQSIRQAVSKSFELQPYSILPVKRGSLPKTSSGKKQRLNARKQFLANELTLIESSLSSNQSQANQKSEKAVQPELPKNSRSPLQTAQDTAQSKSEAYPKLTKVARSEIENWLKNYAAQLLGISSDSIQTSTPLADYGLDSIKAIQISGELEEKLGIPISPTLAYEYPTIELLSEYLSGAAKNPSNSQRTNGHESAVPINGTSNKSSAPPNTSNVEPVAIIGMSCKFPGANSLEEFWKLLSEGKDAISEVPSDRWDVNEYYDASGVRPGTMNTRWGGFIHDVAEFDHEFFGISKREAECMDPQQRILLQTSWEALENAGIAPTTLALSRTGVFIGITGNDYGLLQYNQSDLENPYLLMGNSSSIAANRLSYFLNLAGPSISLDTACSSSLVSVLMACKSLQSGDSDLAIAGGVNLILTPEITINFSRGGYMAPDGRCKSFDSSANGFVRGEGAGIVVLKPLSKAISDGDRVYAVLHGGAVNQDGRSNGLTAPNPLAQEAVLQEAYKATGIHPDFVDYVECHGTGTALGDPIEVNALGKVFRRNDQGASNLLIGSVKSNIGHLEAAAGIAGLIKLSLSLLNREIPKSLHFQNPNPRIDFKRLGIQVNHQHKPWPKRIGENSSKPTVAGISSFGFGGTNAHLVLSGVEPDSEISVDYRKPISSAVIPFSAQNVKGLREISQRYLEHLQKTESWEPHDICYTAGEKRSHFSTRAAIHFTSREELKTELKNLAEGTETANIRIRSGSKNHTRKVVFVFSGQGGQWPGMGLGLVKSQKIYREKLEECSEVIRQKYGWNLMKELEATSESAPIVSQVEIVQPAIFALQISLAHMWRSWGIEPSAVVGHSMGEVAAAYLSGSLSIEDAVSVICERSCLAASSSQSAGMAFIELSMSESVKLIKPYEDKISIAAANAPRATLLSGDLSVLEKLLLQVKQEDVFGKLIKVSYASHSPQMEPIKEELQKKLKFLKPSESEITFYSTVTSTEFDGRNLNSEYWGRNLREPVLFNQTIQQLMQDGHNVFFEMSPHPVLTQSIQQIIQEQGRKAVAIESLRRDLSEDRAMNECIANLYTEGLDPAWGQIYPESKFYPNLPTYPWQTERSWFHVRKNLPINDLETKTQALPGAKQSFAAYPESNIWETRLNEESTSPLSQYKRKGILSAAGWIEIALKAAKESSSHPLETQSATLELKNLKFHQINLDQPSYIQTFLSKGNCKIYSSESKKEWVENFSGFVPSLDSKAKNSSDFKTKNENHFSSSDVIENTSNCTQAIELKEFYENLKNEGISLGAEFENLMELRKGKGIALGKINAQKLQFASFIVPPQILESAFFVFKASSSKLYKKNSGDLRTVLFPASIGSFLVLDSSLESDFLWCYAKLQEESQERLSGNLVFFTSEGKVWAEIEDLVLGEFQISEAKNEGSETEANNPKVEISKSKIKPIDRFYQEFGTIQKENQLESIISHLRTSIAKSLLVSISEIDMEQPLVSIGIDSLVAMEIRNKIEVTTRVSIPLIKLIEGASIKDIAILILPKMQAALNQQTDPHTASEGKTIQDPFTETAITSAVVAETYRLSPQQRRYIADFTLDPERSWSNIIVQSPFPIVCEDSVFEKAFQIVCERHEGLRTLFPTIGSEIRQKIVSDGVLRLRQIHLENEDKNQLEELFSNLREEGNNLVWDFQNGPLGHVVRITTPDKDYVFLMYHRILLDANGITSLLYELMKVTQEVRIGRVKSQNSGVIKYRDFSEWLNALEAKGTFDSSREYWKAELQSPLPDPFYWNRSPGNSRFREGGVASKELPLSIYNELKMKAAKNAWTLSMTLFSIYLISLREAGAGDDLIIDTSLIGRGRKEISSIPGFFTNVVPIRIRMNAKMKFSELVGEVTRKVGQSQQHQYFQYNRIVDELGIDREEKIFPISGLFFSKVDVPTAYENPTYDRILWKKSGTETRYGSMFHALCHPDCIRLEMKHRLKFLPQEIAISVVDSFSRIMEQISKDDAVQEIGDCVTKST